MAVSVLCYRKLLVGYFSPSRHEWAKKMFLSVCKEPTKGSFWSEWVLIDFERWLTIMCGYSHKSTQQWFARVSANMQRQVLKDVHILVRVCLYVV